MSDNNVNVKASTPLPRREGQGGGSAAGSAGGGSGGLD